MASVHQKPDGQLDTTQTARTPGPHVGAFRQQVLESAPANALVFAKGDEADFVLWYFHFALGERPDLAVVATDLLHFDRYQEDLRSNYPKLIIPGPFPWSEAIMGANPSRPFCIVQHSGSTLMDCSQP